MSNLQHRLFVGPEDLSEYATDWNRLWLKSGARQPAVRAECLLNWLEHFGEDRQFVAVCVEDEGQLVAALPLVRDQMRGLGTIYKLPVNCWANSGELLVDRESDVEAVFDCLVDGLQERIASVMMLEEISIDSWHWREYQQAVERNHGRCFVASRQPTGVIDVPEGWEAYQQSWSKNHRSAVKRSHKKLLKEGELRVELQQEPGEELERLLQIAFEIEDKSWKGAAGTSILRTPGMADYVQTEAQLIAEAGYLDFWMLYYNDQPIAFEYDHFAKGTCFSHKIGYDPAYAKLGPGRLLRYLQLPHYFEDEACRVFDMLGTFCDSKAKWATRTYDVARMYCAIGSSWANFLVDGYAWSRPFLQSLRGTHEEVSPEAGASRFLEVMEESPADI